MLTFGLISSVFDYLTFGVLLALLRTTPDQFRTAWLMESVISASVIVLVIRSRRPFFMSKPGPALLFATGAVAAFTIIFPFMPVARFFDLVPIGLIVVLALAGIVFTYVITAEVAKSVFYSRTTL